MTLSKIRNKLPALLAGLIIVVIAGSFLLFNMILLPGNNPATQSADLPEKPVSSIKSQQVYYCTIQEVDPDYVTNETIVHLTDDTLINFPQFETGVKKCLNSSGKWYNGRRFVYDFKESEPQITAFRNLSCKSSNDPECNPLESPVLYEYEGRYLAIGCLPEFGTR